MTENRRRMTDDKPDWAVPNLTRGKTDGGDDSGLKRSPIELTRTCRGEAPPSSGEQIGAKPHHIRLEMSLGPRGEAPRVDGLHDRPGEG